MKTMMTSEAKTGLLVLLAVAALVGLILKVGNFKFFQHGYTIQSRFHFTAGVKKHSPVRLSGVDVGEVKDIRFIYGDQTLIELDLWIRAGCLIRKDSTAYVTTLGLMGEKYIEIKTGSPSSEYAKEGSLILSEDPVRLEELIQVGTKVAGDVSKVANDVSTVTRHLDEAVIGNRPKVDRLFDNFDETSENFRDFSQDIKFHPWKVLIKGRQASKEEMDKERAERLAARARALSGGVKI